MGMASGGYSSGPCDGAGVSTSGRKGVQGGTWVVGGRGWRAEHTKSGEKKMKVTYSNMHKNTTCLSCCVWAGSLQGWLEASWTQRNLLNAMLKIAQRQGIDVQLPLQVGAHCLFHGDRAAMPAQPCHC